ncbi:MAG: SGNH/GDSL hydrolase family protein [Sandaracinaceae bacterium]|nr:SGNH/GDSL hydrolase family protein [Sandaracinaceae bacterium]MBK8411688.1 SGNH/GDSL hydrolase family protein [Sandaracinaceae bacterium]
MSLRPPSSLAPHAPPRHLAALVFLSLGIAGCGSNGLPDAQARGEAQPTPNTGAGSEQAEPATAVAELAEPEEEPASAPPLTPVQRNTLPLITPITDSMRANLRRIAARNADLRDDVFAKMGGSSIVSQAYLHCFAGPDVDLGPHGELSPTLDAFRAADVAGGNVFMRTSEAAGVGWSLRQGMTGRPSRVQREIRTLRPRFALAFFGGNDVQAMNPRVYARRLIALVENLTEQGVIPILGAIQPRRSREMEPWVQRYNSITASVAQAFDLPYVDFHQAMLPLPGLGLAADGVHPNVFRRGPRMLPCDLTDEGLSGGHNIRNLLTLQVLHQVRQALDGPTGAPDASAPPLPLGEGTVTSPEGIATLPFAARLSPSVATLDGYDGCEAAGAPGPERVYRVLVDTPMRIRASVVTPDDEVHVGIYHLGETVDAALCQGGGTPEGMFELAPGLHHFVVEVDPQSARDLHDAPVLFSLVDESE